MINFQGKVVSSDGTNVSDGNYDFEFKLYATAAGGTPLWTETWNSGTSQVAVSDGVFRVGLGTYQSLSSLDFNQDSLYLAVNFNGDGEMSPRIRMTAVPYAFNAQKVAGLTVTDTTGTFTLADGKTFGVNNSLTFSGTDGTTFTFPGSSDEIVSLAAAQTLTNKTVGSTGLTFSGASTDITTASGEDLSLTAGGGGKVVVSVDADTNFKVTAEAAPQLDLAEISNAGQGVTTASVDGLSIDYVQGADPADITGSGLDINVTPSGDAGDTIRGVTIGSITGTSSTEYALTIGSGWDRGLEVGSPAQISSTLTATGVVTIGAGGNIFTFDPAAGPAYAGTARPTKRIVFSAEYPGAVLFADGSNNVGSMTSDYTNAAAAGSRMTYYEWTGQGGNLQDYDVVLRFTLPADFDAWKDGVDSALVIDYATQLATAADNQIDASLRLESLDTADATEVDMVSASPGVWTTGAIDDSELTDCDAAGETCLLELKLQSKNGNYVRVGDVTLQYLAKF
jgi:hypothetical protein